MKLSARPLGICLAALMAVVPCLAQAREITSLNKGWTFIRVDAPAVKDPENDAHMAWQVVDLPHSFNAHDVRAAGDKDAVDSGGTSYYRGPAWYRRSLDLAPKAGQHYYLQFDGATLIADVYVNGQSVGRHEGGYAAFRFDITKALKSGSNLIAVRVDNAKALQVAPLNGDFNISGGLTRGVSLIAAPDVHVDLKDHGGPGVYVTTKAIVPGVWAKKNGKMVQVAPVKADVSARVQLSNEGATDATVQLGLRVLDADGKAVVTKKAPVKVAAGTTLSVSRDFSIDDAHLWNGRESPYLYHVEITAGSDVVTVPLGIRTISVDAKSGFSLNHANYRVDGVNMQQPGRPGKGTAVSDADIDTDMTLINELGATGVRLAHMQHPQRVYDDADKLGLLLTTEVPLVNEVTPGDAFHANIVEQMRELIAQNYNHPSVIMWGLGNELWDNSDTANAVMADLVKTAKEMDPTRPTVYSHCCLADDAAIALHGDVTSYNRYYGWYSGDMGDIGKWADALHAKYPDRVFGISEYGAGASVKQQEDPVGRPATTSYWHPEQYQSKYHEANWKQLSERKWLWSNFIWVAFDFPVYSRNEGDRPSVNDKGLVTEDRLVKKDAYYFYQANWSSKPMIHIASSRYTDRRARAAIVKVYSNQAEVRLSFNGQSLPPQPVVDHMATWKIELKTGDNTIEAFAGKDLHEVAHWTYDDRVE